MAWILMLLLNLFNLLLWVFPIVHASHAFMLVHFYQDLFILTPILNLPFIVTSPSSNLGTTVISNVVETTYQLNDSISQLKFIIDFVPLQVKIHPNTLLPFLANAEGNLVISLVDKNLWFPTSAELLKLLKITFLMAN